MKTKNFYKCLYIIIALIFVSSCCNCGSINDEKERSYIVLLQDEETFIARYNYKGHEYLIVSGSSTGSAIIHSESCPCKVDNNDTAETEMIDSQAYESVYNKKHKKKYYDDGSNTIGFSTRGSFGTRIH